MSSSKKGLPIILRVALLTTILCIGSPLVVSSSAAALHDSQNNSELEKLDSEGGTTRKYNEATSRSRYLSVCRDSLDKRFYLDYNDEKDRPVTRWCEWLNTPERIARACAITEGYKGFKPARETCPVSCDTCPTSSPSTEPSLSPSSEPSLSPSSSPSVNPSSQPSDFCADSKDKRFYLSINEETGKPKTRLCSWLTTEARINEACAVTEGFNGFKPAGEMCPVSCDTCHLLHPSASPSHEPSMTPSGEPSMTPSVEPSMMPSFLPSTTPSVEPSLTPSVEPSLTPSVVPTIDPTLSPSSSPTTIVTPPGPTNAPTKSPVSVSTAAPSLSPSDTLSQSPSASFNEPSFMPSAEPTLSPSSLPSTYYSQTFYIQSTLDFGELGEGPWCLQAANIRENANLNVRQCNNRTKQKWIFDEENGMIRLSKRPEFCIVNPKGKIIKMGNCDNAKNLAEFSFDDGKGGILALKRVVEKFYIGFNAVKKIEPARLYREKAINESLWLWQLEAITESE